MYEEMLQLVKDGLDTPSKEAIESGAKQSDEEEKKGGSSDDDDEGFNDDRDEDFNTEAQNDLLKAKIEADKNAMKADGKGISSTKKNLNKRFDETLQTIQEEPEPENTFQNSH